MAELVNPPAAGRSFGETQRHDTWWIEIIPVVVLLGGFGLYATLRAFEGRFYEWGPYLSPFYSPPIDPNHHWWPFSPFLWRDAIRAFFFDGTIGVGVGTLVLLVNVILLSIYTLSCHSLRHLAGGRLDCFSCAAFGPPRHKTWLWLSGLNQRHMLFAWASLLSVGFADLYVRLVSCGAIRDARLF